MKRSKLISFSSFCKDVAFCDNLSIDDKNKLIFRISTTILIPIPITIYSILFLLMLESIIIPAIFLLSIIISLGHFIRVSKLDISFIISQTEIAAIIDKILILLSSILGLIINDIHNPPLGEIHFLFPLPFPSYCSSAKITVPFSLLILVSAKEIANCWVDGILL